jgi:hypothetical protein
MQQNYGLHNVCKRMYKKIGKGRKRQDLPNRRMSCVSFSAPVNNSREDKQLLKE